MQHNWTKETRIRVGEATRKRMLTLAPAERRAFALRGVAARQAKYPKMAKEALKANRKRERDALKLQTIKQYGGACACCGERTLRFLTIDHINNDGAAHKRAINRAPMYRWLRRHNFPDGFQVLCFNCNCAKGLYGTCPHQDIGTAYTTLY